MKTELHVPLLNFQTTIGHLFARLDTEHAAFLFADVNTDDDQLTLTATAHYLVPTSEFRRQSPYHFELCQDVQAHMIKEAHDRRCSLVELHSHPFPAPAAFSLSDIAGLRDWVTHVRWRLPERPYVALVVSLASFDALVWATDDSEPSSLDALVVGGARLPPTGVTALNWEPE